NGNASTNGFRRVMEEQSGQDLQWFFDQWLRRPGWPQVRSTWKYDPAAHTLTVDLEQTQPGEPYRLPLEISIGDRTEKRELKTRRQSFQFPLPKAPESVTVDPNFWVLMDRFPPN